MLGYSNGKEYFGKEFVKQFESILQNCEENNDFLFIHGTQIEEDANYICKNGLVSDFPELYYTSELIKGEDNLLYDKLKSWPHWACKFLVMCSVSKNSGKGGVPIWRKMEEDKESLVFLPPEFIRGYIDVEQKNIVKNNLYLQVHDYKNLIEDRSYLPITGEVTEISISPEEEEFYNEILNPDR